MTEKLLSPKELADALTRPVSYVYAMIRIGFPMPGYRATLSEARKWLSVNPNPRSEKPMRPMFSGMGSRKDDKK